MSNLSNKSIVMVVAPTEFRDEEFTVPYAIFDKYGADIVVASTKKGYAHGTFGHKIDITCTLADIDINKFNAVVFIGGAGVPLLRSDAMALELAKSAAKHAVLAAICWAPTILAKAGVLTGKRATVWVGDDAEYGMSTDKVLSESGAHFIENPVIVDGNLVTANGYAASAQFAEAVVACLVATDNDSHISE
ncbi:DJ-1/PfpI family protein [bacterium]|nr:DJ-1/PfpI family protein [bacterium]